MTLDSPDSPIKTYVERGFRGHRRYALFPDHVVVKGKSFHGDLEFRVELSALDPRWMRATVRSRNFGAAVILTLVSLGLIAMIVFMDLFVYSRVSHDLGLFGRTCGR